MKETDDNPNTTINDRGEWEWTCGGCGERTTTTHWRQGADGDLFHAGPDAPPSDETNRPQNFKNEP